MQGVYTRTMSVGSTCVCAGIVDCALMPRVLLRSCYAAGLSATLPFLPQMAITSAWRWCHLTTCSKPTHMHTNGLSGGTRK